MDATIVTAFVTGVLGPVLLILVKHILEKNKKKIDPLGEFISFNKLVDDQLSIIKDEVECDRIWISQFHNGGNFYPTGKSIQKFSMFYEHLSPEAESLKDTFKNIPVSLFSKSLAELYEKDELLVSDYTKDKTYGLEIYNNFHSKSSYLFSLRDLNENFLGILGIEYTKKPHKLKEDELIYVKQKASSLGTIFDSYLYTNINKSKK